MAGEYLEQLVIACVGQGAAVSAAFRAAGLPELREVQTPAEGRTDRARLPRLTVSLPGPRRREDRAGSIVETLEVEFSLRFEGNAARAALAEGVAARALAGVGGALQAAVTDGRLLWWSPTGGQVEPDTEVANREVWDVRLRFEARLQWRS